LIKNFNEQKCLKRACRFPVLYAPSHDGHFGLSTISDVLAVDNFIMMDQGAALAAIGSRSVMIYSTTFVWMHGKVSPNLLP
jgi:hypothetical protein